MNALAGLVMTAIGVAFPLAAQGSDMAGTKGTLTVRYTFKARVIAGGKSGDEMAFDQATTVACPLAAGDIAPTSLIQGPTPEQEAARARLDAASPREAAEFRSLEEKMNACRASGKDERTCGREVMAAMRSDPKRRYAKEGAGGADAREKAAAERAFAAVAGRFQSWLDEGCSGTMTVDNRSRQDDPATPGPDPVVRTTGTRGIQPGDPLVTVETDLGRNETRYRFISPRASGFVREAGHGTPARAAAILAIPVASVIAGPHRGPIQSGRYEEPDGSFVIEWTFARPPRN